MKMKADYRKQIKQYLHNLTSQEKANIENSLVLHLLQTETWNQAAMIGITVSQKHEWDTKPIIEKAWSQNKKVCVPKCYPKQSELVFYEITSFDQLESVFYGLLEPVPKQQYKVEKKKIDLMVVPGLVFDSKGYRIGYGGGYYDRYLADYKGLTVSLASTGQFIDSIPNDHYDIPVQQIITETGKLGIDSK